MAQVFKNAKAVLADTATTVYTCPANTTAIVIGAQISNVNANNSNLQFWWTDSSDANAVTRLGYDVTISTNAVYEPIAGKLILEAGDSIIGISSVASALESSISILELS